MTHYTRTKYQQARIRELAYKITQAGLKAYIAKKGTYGYYTDSDGATVICFQLDNLVGGFTFSGNYVTSKPRETGSGWQMHTDGQIPRPESLRNMLKATPPQWAVNGAEWRLTTQADHEARYQKSSEYALYEAPTVEGELRYLVKLPYNGTTETATAPDKDGTHWCLYTPWLNEEDRLAEESEKDREAMRWVTHEELGALLSEHYASQVTPARTITEAEYIEALEVLPPENWTRDGHIEHFRMCEYWSGPITDQYGRIGDEYRTKRIDVTRPETWLQVEDFA